MWNFRAGTGLETWNYPSNTAGRESRQLSEGGKSRRMPSADLNAQLRSRATRPTLASKILFFLLLSGPPKFRLRDPSASLNDEIDWVIVLQLIVWGVAGCWVLLNYLYTRHEDKVRDQRLSSLSMLSSLLVALLSLSIFTSEAPSFSAFKVYQLGITFAFVMLFTKRFGI